MGVFFPIGSGGGGGSYINGTVPTPADLPTTIGTPAIDSVYLAKAPSGIYFLTRKPAGLYCRTANDGALSDWTFLGSFPEVNSDANWRLYNDTTTSKQLAFDLSGISASTTRTLTVPNASGTLVLSNDGRIATIGSGTINTSCSSEDPGTAGSISTYSDYGATAGGYISTIAGSVGNGGYINTSGGGDFDGGYINTSEGGYINTSGQGGSINTTGTGFIQLGTAASNTRTTLNGSASGSNKTITLPNATGTVALLSGSIFTTLNATNGTITASAPVLDLSQTWNNAAVAFTALKLNVTSTNSLSTSLLADFQVGGTSQFKIDRTGNVTVPTSAGYTAGVGRWYDNGTSGFVASVSGADKIRMLGSPDYFILSGTTELTWGSSGVSSIDLRLTREAAGTIAQRNTTNAQTYRLYNTYTSSTTFERLNVRWASNELIIDAEKGSVGGTLRGIKLGSASTSLLGFYGATPAVQGAAVADATDAASAITRLNDLLARVRTLGLIAT